MFIKKIGWIEYVNAWSPAISIKNIRDLENILYYIQPFDSEKIFLISNFLDKQNETNEYKFIIVNSLGTEVDILNSISIKIKSNTDLMKLIIDFEACNDQYKRHFKLNKILK